MNYESIVVDRLNATELSAKDLKMVVPKHEDPVSDRPWLGSDFLFASSAPDDGIYFSFDRKSVTVVPQGMNSGHLYPLILIANYIPVMKVTIGSEPLLGVWDTGWEQTTVDQGFINEHPEFFVPLKISETTIDSNGIYGHQRLYRLKYLKVGPIIIKNARIAGYDFSALDQRLDYPIRIALGPDFMQYGNWMLNFHKKTWSVSPRKGRPFSALNP